MLTALLLGLATPALAQSSVPDNWKFKLDGYYRVRANVFGDLFEGQEQAGTYMTHRVRLQPANPNYPPQFYDDVRIQGKLIGVIRRLD